MIKYNNNTINDWNFGTSNLIKVYRNNAIVFYKVSGESPTPEYKVCFAVVDDISQYQETEFDDVFDNATEKWYKLNNLNQYEEYGVYGSGRTSCEGSSRLPLGYTEVEYIENTGTSTSNGAYLNLGLPLYNTIGNSFVITSRLKSEYYSASGYDDLETIINSESVSSPYYGFVYRYAHSTHNIELSLNPSNHATLSTTANTDGTTSITISCNSTTVTDQVPLGLFASYNANYNTPYRFAKATIYSFTVVKNGDTVRDFVPAKRDSDDKYGLYDLVTDTFYVSPNGNNFVGGDPITPTECVTTYKGKLTIDDGYEYEWNGSSWVNVGEVTGSTATLPNVPFTLNYNAKNYDASTHTIPYTEGALNAIDAVITGTTANIIDHHENGYIQLTGSTSTAIRALVGTTNFSRSNSSPNITIICKAYTPGSSTEGNILSNRNQSYNWMYRHKSTQLRFHGNSEQGSIAVSNTEPNTCSVRIDSSRLLRYNNWTQNTTSTVSGFNYGSDSNGGALFSGYYSTGGEMWKGVFYWIYMSLNTLTDEQVQQVIDYNEEGGGQSEYPKYYSEKSDPLNDLTFNTLAEAQTYAYNNCVYDGMKATINGDRYYFDSSDENGWVKILEYYKVEDVTPNAASGWTISGSSTYNPDSSYYDDFDLETTSTSSSYKIAKVTIYGYDHFTYYLRTSGYSSWCYVVATNVDEIQTPPTSMSYNSASAITSTYGFTKAPKSAVNLSNYRRVTYNNLDKTVEHTFYVYFYGQTFSSYVGNATILIPKEQTNENWEQVTFSASSNVASSNKNLYIDNNNSTSGGTSYWYNRWMIGLPSGSHSSYTNYSNYEYCPNVTSSTFTSVAGEQRQVNFTYDNTTNKTLSFRLTDGSNVLTPSDTVYYNMTYYNSCNVSSSYSNETFPRTKIVKVGGRFRFANSSNRHYIYGYSPNISLNYDYYIDNYQDTFDIVYTKLNDEAVTITYTTYDPSDTEVPTFKTDITYPYNGGTTSSTTLTSFDVPYTYPYEVSQTSDMFSANSQSFTAGQASRTISFTLYPNNREFASVADLEAYGYAWEGMKANVGDTNYKYENGEWVEITSKDSDFVIGDFNTFVSSSTEVTEGYYIIYNYNYNSSYANKNYLFSWNSGNTWNGYYTLGNMNHTNSDTSVPISSSEIIDDAVWELKDAGNGNFYIRNVATNKYWYYLGTSTSYGVPLTDNANDATPVSIQDWNNCLAFVEKQNSSNYPINRLYSYSYRYGWYGNLASDGNNQYYMRKYVP